MNNISISLEELEFLLIKNKCEYLFGFPDAFIKIERTDVSKRFDIIADNLESRNLITRSFKGETTYDDTIRKVIDDIIAVDKYYDITIIESNVVNKKYRIYNSKDDYVVIEIFSKGNSELDYSQMYIYLYDKATLLDRADKVSNKLFKDCLEKNDISIDIPSELYQSINKLSEEKFIAKYKNASENDTKLIKTAYKTITYAEKVLSFAVTDMTERKSKVYMYVYGLKNLLAMEFKMEKKEYKWITKQIDNSEFDEEINKVFK